MPAEVGRLSPEPFNRITEYQLLQTMVAVTRHLYRAAASSVFMLSPDGGELIFAAVAGEGEESLIGRRLPADTGIAGWVAASGEVVIADDLAASDMFARDVAASTGYVPRSIMAAPLVADGQCIGVLEVLDRHAAGSGEPVSELDDMELLGLLAQQAALSLELVRRSQRRPPAMVPLGNLVGRLSEHAILGSRDPLAATLLRVSLDLLDRGHSHPQLAE
jgi:GAF domain-containing protein